jgi:hypothetical protein
MGKIIWDEPGSTLYGEPVQQSNPAQEIAQGVSDFARGYAQGAEQYQATQPQHGTMTATTITAGQLPTTTWIHY